MEEGTMESIQIEYLNLLNLMYAFKIVRNMEKFLEENAHAPDGTQPILTRETMTYAISLSISCVCLHANNNFLKSRASAAYERAMSDLKCRSDDTWHTLLQDVLVWYIKLLTNSEGPAPLAPTLTRKEIIEHDTTRKEARAAAAAAAAAAADGGSDSCGDGGGGDDASGHMVMRTRPPSRPPRRRPAAPRRARRQRRPRRGERRSEPFVGHLFPRHHCHDGAWNKPILVNNTRVRIE